MYVTHPPPPPTPSKCCFVALPAVEHYLLCMDDQKYDGPGTGTGTDGMRKKILIVTCGAGF